MRLHRFHYFYRHVKGEKTTEIQFCLAEQSVLAQFNIELSAWGGRAPAVTHSGKYVNQ